MAENCCVYSAIGFAVGIGMIYDGAQKYLLAQKIRKMLVEPQGAQITIPVDATYRATFPGIFGIQHKPMDSNVLAFVDSPDADRRRTFMNHKNEGVRIMESCIAEGDPLYVLGS